MIKVGLQSLSKNLQLQRGGFGCLKSSIPQRSFNTTTRRLLPRMGGGGGGSGGAGYTFNQQQGTGTSGTSAEAKSKYATAALAVGGTILGTHFVLNRETREGGLSPFEAKYLNETFTWLGGGLATVTAFSVGLFRSNVTARLMAMNPWAFAGISLVGSIGSLMGMRMTAPDNKGGKTAFWFLFNAAQAATLSPLLYVAPPALMVRAGLYTAGVIGSLSYVGATSKNDTYLYLGGPLLAGCVVIAISSLIPMFRVGAGVANAASNVSLYGGLAVFGGFTLYDTQRILQKARMIEGGAPIPYDPLNESISLELNFINLFIRILTILMNGQGGNRRR
ncbi:Growth hormone-inducible transmembrane protein [Wallemia ichthyophaga EXF-994]|uniref:Growth hormone-inducible transmembrane protein n=1 Tax=Wallemia ichthyophaga (strain EXF-994 / CBS 113033) TaxID=1299270 RepID=R9ADJ0_WALI9|nr:Growth hormone-inducible transmembrane protein [Wallemia ichthyophaga EXF-994]EOR00242.1 Growth hormone-inducible transmembrane protein [Wallemia ichthyophaga EXF-994]